MPLKDFPIWTRPRHHLDWAGFWTYTCIFVAVFFAWADTSVYNSLYISTDIPHRVVMAVQIVTMMIIAAAIPEITTAAGRSSRSAMR
ncbi:low temperature requirement protein A [Salipiger sp.]|uniref:low temperature requirement protein A n=1 Tax=Salipiger sp. TaxID=2078585 RepID=UPI003A97F0F7